MAEKNNKASSSSKDAMALVGMTSSINIPRAHDVRARNGKDSFAAVAAKSLPPGKGRHAALPTPPNSISPSLPPQAFKEREHSAPLTPPGQSTESDIDLQDAVEHAAAQDQPERGLAQARLAALDTAGAITPTLLATHHLPEILLTHGPLAIRHVMGYLTTSVPGFSGIQPAKARRLVVGALEGRGGASGDAMGGVDGDVLFEKVGWGRWDARRQGDAPRQLPRQTSPTAMRHMAHGSLRGHSPYGARSTHLSQRPRQSTRPRIPTSKSLARSHDSPDLLPFGDEVHPDYGSMSLDEEDASVSARGSSSAPDDTSLILDGDDPDDVTDEEDWASIGAAALRAGSIPKGATNKKAGKPIDYNARARRDSGGFPRGGSSTLLAKSAPGVGKVQLAYRHKADRRREKERERRESQEYHPAPVDSNGRNLLEGVGEDENEAIQALLKLGSI